MLASPALLLFVLLAFLAVLLLLRRRRAGPRITWSRIVRAPFLWPRSPAHWFINLLWWYVTAMWVYAMFVQPVLNPGIRQEYFALAGGLAGAWLMLSLLYLPYLVLYVWIVAYLDERDRKRIEL